MSAQRRVFTFEGFRLDPDNHLLTYTGSGADQPVALTPKAFDTLRVLVEHHGEVLAKDQLLKLVWPGTFVEEANLTQNVYTLRKTFSELQPTGSFIETIPRRGYRFVAPVTLVQGVFDTAAMPAPVSSAPTPTEPSAEASQPPHLPTSSLNVPRSARPGLWLAVGLALVLVGLVTVWALGLGRRAETPSRPGTRLTSIAVLPFESLNPRPDDTYLGLGMADALITRLSNQHQLIVRPTSAIRRYTEPPRDVVTIGRDLKVDAVLDGTLQRSGDTLRASVQLVAVATGAPLWAQSFDSSESDLFDLQDALSERLAAELKLQLNERQRARLTLRATSDPAAYAAYVRGRYFWNRRTEESLWKALENFRQAIALDSGYAAAYAGLADTYVLLPLFGTTPTREAFPEAIANAERALELDPELAEAHTALAYARFLYEWRWEDAEAEFRSAIDLNPSYPTARQWYSFLLAALGRGAEAEAEAKRAVELDPLSLAINTDLGMVYFFGGRFAEAKAQFEHTLELDAAFPYARFGLGHALLQLGMKAEAVTQFERASELSDNAIYSSGLGLAYAANNREEEARKILADLRDQARSGYVDSSHLAVLEAWLGRKKQALELLGKACDERSRFAVFLNRWSPYEPLKGEPGWEELVARVGLPGR